MSDKNLDRKGRWRQDTIAFRVSKEERKEIDERYLLLGYRVKQDYMIESVLYQKVVATENPGMIMRFKKDLQLMMDELVKKEETDVRMEVFEPLRTMLEILEAFQEQLKKTKENEVNGGSRQ